MNSRRALTRGCSFGVAIVSVLAALTLNACVDPTDPGPTPVGPFVVTVGEERVNDDRSTSNLPDPPSATLRAPADPRIEEVDSQTGLPRIR